jgi:hypothetical protein
MQLQQLTDIAYFKSVKEHYPFDLADFIFEEEQYVIKVFCVGEIRFGPSYYSVQVNDYFDNVIWKGNGIYGGELFNRNIYSQPYDKLILVKWNSITDPGKQQVVEIDLMKGIERVITEENRYYLAGHFYSFDGVFYSSLADKDLICRNFETQTTFLLFETIQKIIPNAISWSISPVTNCIIVVTTDENANLYLFDIIHLKIVESNFLGIVISNKNELDLFLDKKRMALLIHYQYYSDTTNGYNTAKDQYFEIDF